MISPEKMSWLIAWCVALSVIAVYLSVLGPGS